MSKAKIVSVYMPEPFKKGELARELIEAVNVGDILMPVGAATDGQGPQMAWLAVKRYFKPQIVIPMHFGALPGSSTEADVRGAVGKDPRVIFMKPGETKKF